MEESERLYGPYPLRQETIKDLVILASPGTYVLGDSDAAGFHARSVGRSDVDVAARIREFVGFYSEFKFAYCDTAHAAFESECRLYHEFVRSLDSALHPSRRAYSTWRCPHCSIFDY
jgi:hypothetical protein